jgi:hypothetical protein
MAQGWCNTVMFDRLGAPQVEALDLAPRVFVPFSAIHISLGQVPDILTLGNP